MSLPHRTAATMVAPGERPRYTEVAPRPALAPWVECFWTMRAIEAPAVPNRVLPDGCSDVIVGLGDISGPVAVGTMRAAEVYPLSGRVDYVGVRFLPGRALPFLGVPLGELTGLRVPLDDLWGNDARTLADAPPEARLVTIERALHERLRQWSRCRRGDDALAVRAVELLRQSRGGAGVRDVAAALGVGERRLERAFDRCVGLSPKTLARVLRFREVVERIGRLRDRGTDAGWTAIAFDAGYADQSHLIRDFRELAGVTPARYVAERSGVGFVQYDWTGTA